MKESAKSNNNNNSSRNNNNNSSSSNNNNNSSNNNINNNNNNSSNNINNNNNNNDNDDSNNNNEKTSKGTPKTLNREVSPLLLSRCSRSRVQRTVGKSSCDLGHGRPDVPHQRHSHVSSGHALPLWGTDHLGGVH